jgi:hypothetical protein
VVAIGCGANQYVIYTRPKDFPANVIVVRWEIIPEGIRRTEDITVCANIEDARASLPPGLVRLERDRKDDPVITEVWI